MRTREIDKKIAARIASIGYDKIGSLLYKLESPSEDVQNIIMFSISKKAYRVIFCGFSFRNNEAEEFGLFCIKKYGNEMYRYLEKRGGIFVHLRISLGMMAGWQSGGGLYVGDEEIEGSIERIYNDISTIVLPVAGHIRTKEELLRLLLSDDDLAPWFRTNAAIRAANSIFLMVRLGYNGNRICEEISPYFSFMERSKLKISVVDYVNVVIEEAVSFRLL